MTLTRIDSERARTSRVPATGDDRPRAAGRVAVVALFLLTYSGYVKDFPFVRLLPADLTVVAAAVTALFVLAAAVHASRKKPGVGALVVLWVSFLPGVIIATTRGLGLEKSMLLFSITPLCVLGSGLLLNHMRLIRLWLALHVVLASLSAVLLIFSPSSSALSSGRLSAEGSTTVLSSRLIFSGVLVLFILALRAPSRPQAFACLAGATGLVTAGLMVGSRGPFVATCVAALSILVTLRSQKKLGRVLILLIGSSAALYAYLANSTSFSAQRIRHVFSDELANGDRWPLWRAAIEGGINHVLGQGWGSFATFREFQGAQVRYEYPHNILLETWFESGLVAVAALILVTIWCLRRLQVFAKHIPAEGAVLYGLAIYWVINSLVSSDINGNKATWAALGCAVAVGGLRDTAPIARACQAASAKIVTAVASKDPQGRPKPSLSTLVEAPGSS